MKLWTPIKRLIRGRSEDNLLYIGIIKCRILPPGLTEEEFLKWWPRVSFKERERYTVAETRNLITTAGRTQILAYIGATSLGSLTPFSMYFAVGTTAITQVYPGDNAVQGELFRAVPGSSIIAGNTVQVSTFFGTSQANGTWTNCGLFGVNATGTSGSGSLMTHALYPYGKNSSQTATNDYAITLN